MSYNEEHYLGNPLLKKANTTVELSKEQLIEMGKCLDDPIYFAKNYIKIVTLDEGLVNFQPYPFQEEMLMNFHRKRFNVCKLPRQPLWIETPIPTTNGWKSLDDIIVGDYVYNIKGQPVLVTNKTEIFHNTPCYKITFDCEEEIIADEDHIWPINNQLLKTSEIFNQFLQGKKLSIESRIVPKDYSDSVITPTEIINIKIIDSVPVVCITVDSDDHLFLCGRNFIPTKNSGKSTTTVAFLVHHIVFNEHTSIAILANKASTAKDILSRLQTAYENLPKWMQMGVKSWNKTSMELENGSKVIAASTSASSVRGGTYSLLMLDEYAFVPQQVAENFMRSVYPTITSGRDSKVIIVSCVTKDTYLLTPKGYRRIDSLVEFDKSGAYFTKDYTVRGRDKFYSSNILVNSGRAPTNIITTRYDSIECSEDHKLWAYCNGVYGYVKSNDLKVGDYIALIYNNQVFGNDDSVNYFPDVDKSKNTFRCDTINEDVAYLLGLYVAKGYAREIFSKKTGKLIGGQFVITCENDISEVFNNLNIKFNKVNNDHYVISSKNIVGFLKYLGFIVTNKSQSKLLPPKILSWSKKNLTSLLRGLFDSDGSITKKGTITYSSISRELIRQVQLILSNLGIIGSIYKSVSSLSKKTKLFSTCYSIEISGIYALKYDQEIGFKIQKKSDRFSKIFLSSKNEELKEFLDYDVDDNLIWVKIKNIEKSENEVFDVSLPDIEGDKWCHSVLYNNFLGHQTPAGLNHYYKLWTDAKNCKNDYHPFEIHWSDVPGRDQQWRETQIKNIGQKAFDQEFNTDFLGSSETLISGSKLANIITKSAIKTINDLDVFEDPKDEHVYVTIVDTARGVEKDYSAFVVVDATNLPYKVVAKYRSNDIKPEMYSYIVKDVATKYNTSFILCEVNDIGNQIARDLVEDGYPNMLYCSTKSRSGQFVGQNFSGKYEMGVKMQKNIKKVGALSLKTLIEEDKIIINDYDIFAELTTFIQKGPSFEAEVGKNDDLVVCLLLFAWLTTNQYFKDITSIDLRKKLLLEKKEKDDEDILPFGFVNLEDSVIIDTKSDIVWQVVDNEEMDLMLNLFNYY